MICPNCGTNLPDTIKFCGRCGFEQQVRAQMAQQAATPPIVSTQPPPLPIATTGGMAGVNGQNIPLPYSHNGTNMSPPPITPAPQLQPAPQPQAPPQAPPVVKVVKAASAVKKIIAVILAVSVVASGAVFFWDWNEMKPKVPWGDKAAVETSSEVSSGASSAFGAESFSSVSISQTTLDSMMPVLRLAASAAANIRAKDGESALTSGYLLASNIMPSVASVLYEVDGESSLEKAFITKEEMSTLLKETLDHNYTSSVEFFEIGAYNDGWIWQPIGSVPIDIHIISIDDSRPVITVIFAATRQENGETYLVGQFEARIIANKDSRFCGYMLSNVSWINTPMKSFVVEDITYEYYFGAEYLTDGNMASYALCGINNIYDNVITLVADRAPSHAIHGIEIVGGAQDSEDNFSAYSVPTEIEIIITWEDDNESMYTINTPYIYGKPVASLVISDDRKAKSIMISVVGVSESAEDIFAISEIIVY